MKYPPLIQATLVERINRFVVKVKISNQVQLALLRNTGRLAELLIPGAKARCIAAPVSKPDRKTRFDLVIVRYKGRWVSVNSHLANDLFAESIEKKTIPEFKGHSIEKREVTIGDSRLDFLLSKNDRKVFIEVKSVTLVKEGCAQFPDAPTERGIKHLRKLATLAQNGHEAAIVFVVQRNDAVSFSPNWETHPAFGDALLQAQKDGVKVIAYRCAVGEKSIRIKNRISFIPSFSIRST